ncbi:5'-AMP-activated protein kinase subunit beta-2 [Bonamia ostreae]|uniref:5'-AMP-activated protein kinase subunit beta-2 n=1 Tax=Bonamia ostreae TaxID=126728 RepID=A0ABV2AH95_9EUKA
MKTECEYGQKFPDESLYKKEPPTLPPHLSYVLLNYPPHDILDPSTLPIPQHVTVNHGYTLVDESSGVKILAVTQRVKSKFVTTTFYKPVEADS